MMQNQKSEYFVPNIEDIRVGYECELKFSDGKWTPYIVKGTILFGIDALSLQNDVRVPYLTKEQIEKEGWKYIQNEHGVHHGFTKDHPCGKGWVILNARGWIGYTARELQIYEEFVPNNIDVVFKGECKDINTFRYICKLLGI